MSTIARLALSTLAALLAGASALAQQAPAAPAPAPAPVASMPQDCKTMMKKHDHGAEKGMPTPRSSACADMPASAAAKKRTAPVHDHGKVHKNQG